MPVPAITVLMPVRDGAAHLHASVDSVLGQRFKDFELVVVDDGSIDATPGILHRYAARDPRIVVLRQERDGLVAALNRGIAASKAPLIARLDADDIAMPERLGRQVEVMHARSELGLLGGRAETIDESGRVTGQRTPATSHEHLVTALLKSNPMIHSTVVFRKDLVAELGGFRQAFEAAEDYDLWLRISERARIANLPECLIRYREHGTGVSARTAMRSAFSARLARRAAAMRRAGLPDPARDLMSPPDWRDPPRNAFYAQDARDFALLEFASPEAARSLGFDHLDPTTLRGLPGRLNHKERKIAQRALLNILERTDRPSSFSAMKLWATYFFLHPLRAVKIAVTERRSSRTQPGDRNGRASVT